MIEQFLELLRAGLWERTANENLFKGQVNWAAIYHLALRQTVIAVAYDGMQTLPSSARPERSLLMQWTAQVARIENANEHLNRVAAQLFVLYRKEEIPLVLLKGQGVATLYPVANHRQCGDIDVFAGKKEYQKASDLLLRKGGVINHEEHHRHTTFDYQKACIEIHRTAGELHSPFTDPRFQRLSEHSLSKDTRNILLNDTEIAIPNATFNAIYLFLHAFTHFLNSGIGLRHVCDWARLIATQHATIDAREVNAFFRKAHLERAAGAFAAVAVQYTGLDEHLLPFELSAKDYTRSKVLFKDMLKTGNFGQHDLAAGQRPPGYWAGKWYTFSRAFKRCVQLGKFAPTEACWYPLFLIRNRIALQLKKTGL